MWTCRKKKASAHSHLALSRRRCPEKGEEDEAASGHVLQDLRLANTTLKGGIS